MFNSFKIKPVFNVLILSGSLLIISLCGYVLHIYFHQTTRESIQHNVFFEKISADKSQVKEIYADVNDLKESMGFMEAAISEFAIPAKYHSIILKAIFPAKRYEYPRSWDDIVLGHIIIKSKTDEIARIAYCNAGANPLCYSVDGIHYMRDGPYQPVISEKDSRDDLCKDEGGLLLSIVREVFEEQKKKRQSPVLFELIDTLKRSIGELPPKRKL